MMAVEVPTKYGGVGASFFTCCLVIEELAKTDPSVSVMCDVQNTLVNTLLLKLGTDAQKNKYLPLTSKDTVGSHLCLVCVCSIVDPLRPNYFLLQRFRLRFMRWTLVCEVSGDVIDCHPKQMPNFWKLQRYFSNSNWKDLGQGTESYWDIHVIGIWHGVMM